MLKLAVMKSAEQSITEAEFRSIKPQRIDVFRFLNLDSHPTLDELEKWYLRVICRNVPLIQRPVYTKGMGQDELYYPEGWVQGLTKGSDKDLYTQLLKRTFTHSNLGQMVESRNLQQIATELAYTRASSWVLHAIKSAQSGNFLKRTLIGKGDCLDVALTLTLIGRLANKRETRDITLVPYNITSKSDLNRRAFNSLRWNEKVVYAAMNPSVLGHDHYGVTWRSNNQRFLSFTGFVVPSSVIEPSNQDRRGRMQNYLAQAYPQNHPLSEAELDKVNLHAIAINRASKKLPAR